MVALLISILFQDLDILLCCSLPLFIFSVLKTQLLAYLNIPEVTSPLPLIAFFTTCLLFIIFY